MFEVQFENDAFNTFQSFCIDNADIFFFSKLFLKDDPSIKEAIFKTRHEYL